MSSSLSEQEKMAVQVDFLTREDTIVLNDNGAIIEKGLILHGCNPSVRVGDTIIAVNNKQFETNEDLSQVVNLHIPYECGDLLGITIKDLMVTDIQNGSIGETKFKLQDKLIDINGIKLHEDEQFYHLLQRINEDLEVNVMRNVVKNDDTVIMAGTSPSVTTTIYTVLISLSMAPCEALGVRPDENLMISRIMDKSHAQGKFELGDVIKKLNGIPIKDRNQFFKLFEDATTGKRIVVERSAERELELEKRLLPPNIEKIIKRHAGYDYIIVNVRYDSSAGRPFGLNIANVTAHKIIIPEVAENTVAGDY
uniref:Bm9144 n=1 Tax=Brugia malayi TaxID=6279 RepID=A0A0H5S4E1_BRUMA|nr:Bm9144 [Brugia malayi]